MNLKYFTQETWEKLWIEISYNIENYKNKNFHDKNQLSGCEYHKEIDIKPLANLENHSDNDAENSILVYKVLEKLTPAEAQFDIIWTHLSHIDCIDYMSNRWKPKYDINSYDDLRNLEKDQQNKIINHYQDRYFVRKTRSLFSLNGISRLWWTSFICSQLKDYGCSLEMEEAVNIAFSTEDVHSGIFERPSISSNFKILSIIFEHLSKNKDMQQDGKGRTRRRNWLKKINLEFSGKISNAYSESELYKKIESLDDHV